MEKLNKKITMKGYEQKVPEQVRNENLEKMRVYETEKKENQKSIDEFQKFI